MGETEDRVAPDGSDGVLHVGKHRGATDLHQRHRRIGDVWFRRNAVESDVCQRDKSPEPLQQRYPPRPDLTRYPIM